MAFTTQQINLFSETLPLAYSDAGKGRPYLLLHGGAGPQSMAGLAEALGEDGCVIVPVHPGFFGQPRPEGFNRPADLVLAYLALLDHLDLRDVVIVGNSFGGWLAAEMGLRRSPRIAGISLLNAVGIDTGSPEKLIADPMKLPPAELVAKAFYDPKRYALAPASAEAAAMMAANQKALRVYAGEPFMHDPSLYERLSDLSVRSQVIWGESDQIVDVDYGRRFATQMRAEFALVAQAGHFPQIEQLDRVKKLVRDFSGDGALGS